MDQVTVACNILWDYFSYLPLQTVRWVCCAGLSASQQTGDPKDSFMCFLYFYSPALYSISLILYIYISCTITFSLQDKKIGNCSFVNLDAKDLIL